jgi:hypothetical protein
LPPSTQIPSVGELQFEDDRTIHVIRDVAALEKIPFPHILVDEDGSAGRGGPMHRV